MLFIQYPLSLCFYVMRGVLPSENAAAHQRGHVSSVHLSCGDLLLRRGHGADVVGVGATDRAGPYYTRQCDGAVLHATHPIELLLQNCRPCTGEKETKSATHIFSYPGTTDTD